MGRVGDVAGAQVLHPQRHRELLHQGQLPCSPNPRQVHKCGPLDGGSYVQSDQDPLAISVSYPGSQVVGAGAGAGPLHVPISEQGAAGDVGQNLDLLEADLPAALSHRGQCADCRGDLTLPSPWNSSGHRSVNEAALMPLPPGVNCGPGPSARTTMSRVTVSPWAWRTTNAHTTPSRAWSSRPAYNSGHSASKYPVVLDILPLLLGAGARLTRPHDTPPTPSTGPVETSTPRSGAESAPSTRSVSHLPPRGCLRTALSELAATAPNPSSQPRPTRAPDRAPAARA